jgi:hypothetical protein
LGDAFFRRRDLSQVSFPLSQVSSFDGSVHLRRQMNTAERLDTKRFRQETASNVVLRRSRQDAEITDSGPGPSGLANTNGNAGAPSDLASIGATQHP